MTRTAVCESPAPTAPPITAPARQHPPRSQLAAADAAGACAVPTLGAQPAVCTHQPSKTRPSEGGAASGGPQAVCRSPLAPQDAHSAPWTHHRRRPRRGIVEAASQIPAQPRSASTPALSQPPVRGAPGVASGTRTRRGGRTPARRPAGVTTTNAQPSRPNPIRSPRWRPGGGVGVAAGAGPSADPPRAAARRNSTRHPRNTPRQPPRLAARDPALCRCASADPSSRLASRPRHQPRPMAVCSDPVGPHPLSGALPTAAAGLRWRSGSVAASDRAPFTDRRDTPPASTRKSTGDHFLSVPASAAHF